MTAPKMTRVEARAEAKRRYGEERGIVVHLYPGSPIEEFRIGELVGLSDEEWRGRGNSWEAAFADADRQAGAK